MRASFVTLATIILAGAFLALAAPSAVGDHCSTRILAFGRISMTPQPVPPYLQSTQGMCTTALQETPAGAHAFPPNADQVFLRINGDFGASIRTVRVELTGLGFEAHAITLERKAHDMGGFTYESNEWRFMPAPAASDSLVVTAFYPDGPQTATFQRALVNLPVPALPAITAPQLPPSVG